MCMTEYLPDKTTSEHDHHKHSTTSPCSRSSRSTRSYSTAAVSGSHGGTRRQSAYPHCTRPPSATVHGRRRQHSIAHPPRRSTLSDDKIVELSSCLGSRQFTPPGGSGIRHSRTELIGNQVSLVQVGNNISSRSSDAVDEVVVAGARSRRFTGGSVLSPGAARRLAMGPSSSSTSGDRALSPAFEEVDETSPTSLSQSTRRGDSNGSPAIVPAHRDGSPADPAAADNLPLAPTVVLHVSAATRADLVDIRAMLASYMKRLADQDAMAGVTKEWRIVAKVFDRLFFFLYCATIIFSLSTIFPRA